MFSPRILILGEMEGRADRSSSEQKSGGAVVIASIFFSMTVLLNGCAASANICPGWSCA